MRRRTYLGQPCSAACREGAVEQILAGTENYPSGDHENRPNLERPPVRWTGHLDIGRRMRGRGSDIMENARSGQQRIFNSRNELKIDILR
ncbi:hypothetical protein EVAR_27947_1 [Eumeta japonica]|uniref:Uncharacterized protein n=1 Tax=Eumeta variegata TaxID=151549 RepID=A0A4C1UWG6_EUMVA|nr:hypothetical protein EVAR_27947_1 [Eumeta japonica]